ncbi:hypothetical protein PMZ80_005505 [Knufia obscura]|uniref:Arrestin-like N-terminal domain-containing protein n=1 Tax=Knufia obscura TaxID=1635080 RepID=A0ABR0RME2_9EURO|nr:hypothetical protein PMZ80_005505 [Knufia obscura]
MPRAKEKSSSGLSIDISEPRKFYTPGSSISGNVTLNTAQDFAIGSVSLEFYGRVKVFFVYSHGQGESNWRGRAPLFSEQQLLYEGYHTHKPGSFSWPFVAEIPACPDAAVVRQSKHQWKELDHFLSTDDYIPNHSMPPTFNMRKWGFGYRWHIFIEYVIKVNIKEASGASMVLPPSSRRAILPIMVRDVVKPESNTFTLPLATHFTLPDQLTEKTSLERTPSKLPTFQSQVLRRTIRSSKLSTWDRDKGVPSKTFTFSNTIKDKTRAVFSPDSLPAFTFDITVSTPSNIHVLDARGISMMVSARSVTDDALTTIPIDRYPDVRILNVTLIVGISTYFRFKCPFSDHGKVRYDVKLLDRQPANHSIDMRRSQDRSMPFLDTDGEEAVTEAVLAHSVDLAKLPGLAAALVSARLGLQTEKPLVPTFNSYVISREYTLQWRLELDVAGEKVTVSNNDKIRVKVLPPEAKDLEAVLGHADASKAEAEDDNDKDDDKEESEDESITTKDSKEGMRGVFKTLRSKKTKQEEAAEEASAAAGPSSSPSDVLQDPAGEALPSYQQAPTDFGYRHEIDERPPRYEAE